MSRISAIVAVCSCCGQPIKPATRKGAPSFRGYDDFVAAYNAARHAAIDALGERWYLVPGASQWARIPAKWAACKVFGRVSNAPRDQRLPAAQFWPSGTLPVGPEYAAPVAPATVVPAWRARIRELAQRHTSAIAEYRTLWSHMPDHDSAAYFGHVAKLRTEAATYARMVRFAEAA
jgi:hypothetical protein